MVHSLWFMVHGLWFMVLGSWFMVLGSWFVANCSDQRAIRLGPKLLKDNSGLLGALA
jgi:hypothetical protein